MRQTTACVLTLLALGVAPCAAAMPAAPRVGSGGRANLTVAASQLQQHSQALRSRTQSEQASCDRARASGQDCSVTLRGTLTRLLAVAEGLLDVRQQLLARLAEAAPSQQDREACSTRRQAEACARLQSDDTALDAYASLRIAPAIDGLWRLAADAERDLLVAREANQAIHAKLPQSPAPAVAAPPPRLAPPTPEPREAPRPAAELLAACRAGKAASCLQAAGLWEARGALGEARIWYKLACRHGAKTACAKAK